MAGSPRGTDRNLGQRPYFRGEYRSPERDHVLAVLWRELAERRSRSIGIERRRLPEAGAGANLGGQVTSGQRKTGRFAGRPRQGEFYCAAASGPKSVWPLGRQLRARNQRLPW